MLKRSPQQSRILLSVSGILTIVLCFLPFSGYDPSSVNYTGLFQLSPVRTWICMAAALFFQSVLFLCAASRHLPGSAFRIPAMALLAGVVVLMILPYRSEHDLFTNLHLLLAFGVLVLLNVLVFRILLYHQKLLAFYAGGCLLSFFIALTAASINGISELVYALVLTLTLLAAAKK